MLLLSQACTTPGAKPNDGRLEMLVRDQRRIDSMLSVYAKALEDQNLIEGY